jgi:hypothetical protein
MSNLGKIRRQSKPQSLVRSIKGLFGTNKSVNPRKLYPDAYYKQVFLSRPVFTGMEHLAKVFETSKVRTTNKIMEAGISSLLGEAIVADARAAIAAAEAGKRYWHNRAIRELRKWAEENGYDLSDINKVAMVKPPIA